MYMYTYTYTYIYTHTHICRSVCTNVGQEQSHCQVRNKFFMFTGKQLIDVGGYF